MSELLSGCGHCDCHQSVSENLGPLKSPAVKSAAKNRGFVSALEGKNTKMHVSHMCLFFSDQRCVLMSS
jgi:hypothetical protein